MINSIVDMLAYIDSIDPALGDELYCIIDNLRRDDSENRLLERGVINTYSRSLALASEEDYFLVNNCHEWELVKIKNTILSIGNSSEFTHAFYVEHTGKYAHAVGHFTFTSPEEDIKEVPPL